MRRDMAFELESEGYWNYVDWVLQEPDLRAGPYLRPMFEILDPEPCDTDEDCMCMIS